MDNKIPALLDASKLRIGLIIFALFVLPIWGFLVWIGTSNFVESFDLLLPAIFYVGIGIVLFSLSFILTSIQKDIYFWRIFGASITIAYIFVAGNWLCFTSILATSLHNVVSQPITYILSAFLFIALCTTSFLKHYSDFKRNERDIYKSLRIENSYIDPANARIHNEKIEEEQMAKSPFALPVKLFLWLGIPLGGGGCGLMMNHMGASSQLIVIAFATFSTLILGIISGMPSYFTVYVYAYLQIKHRKWFKIKRITFYFHFQSFKIIVGAVPCAAEKARRRGKK